MMRSNHYECSDRNNIPCQRKFRPGILNEGVECSG